MSVLTVSDLEVRYGNTVAVNGVSFTVGDGEFVTLLGPSGCGKTTTLRCIAGLEHAAGGSVAIDGRVVSSPSTHVRPENRQINMVFQSYAVWPHMSVFENVAYGLRARRLPRSEIRDRVFAALALVHLDAFKDRYGTELSGGQQQRLALARAVVTEPKILLFDEPLSNLDAALRDRMRSELIELHRRIGTTSVYVTHDQAEAMVMSDTIVLMRDGVIDQIGAPREIYRRPKTHFAATFVGAANLLKATVKAVDHGNITATVDGQMDVQATRNADGEPVAAGSNVQLVLRPEDIKIVGIESDAVGNRWTAKVDSLAYLGSRVEYVLDVNGVQIKSAGEDLPHINLGDIVTVAADPALVTCLPSAP